MIYLLTTLAAFLLSLSMKPGKRYTGLRWDLQRALIRKRDDYKCRACGCRAVYNGVWFECDHIVPISKGGNHSPFNLRMLCKTCHDERHNKFDKMKG